MKNHKLGELARYQRFMGFVDMKKVDQKIEARIMVLINRVPEKGMSVAAIKRYFEPSGLQKRILIEDIPGWVALSQIKRAHRVAKVISYLVKSDRARIDKDAYSYDGGMLIPLNVLDKIVFALEREESVDGEE